MPKRRYARAWIWGLRRPMTGRFWVMQPCLGFLFVTSWIMLFGTHLRADKWMYESSESARRWCFLLLIPGREFRRKRVMWWCRGFIAGLAAVKKVVGWSYQSKNA